MVSRPRRGSRRPIVAIVWVIGTPRAAPLHYADPASVGGVTLRKHQRLRKGEPVVEGGVKSQFASPAYDTAYRAPALSPAACEDPTRRNHDHGIESRGANRHASPLRRHEHRLRGASSSRLARDRSRERAGMAEVALKTPRGRPAQGGQFHSPHQRKSLKTQDLRLPLGNGS
jgi:hypothetical protein